MKYVLKLGARFCRSQTRQAECRPFFSPSKSSTKITVCFTTVKQSLGVIFQHSAQLEFFARQTWNVTPQQTPRLTFRKHNY